jgi:hypothetical protein
MQLTSKFVLLAVALAYGGTTISALPVGKSSLVSTQEPLDTSHSASLSKPVSGGPITPATPVHPATEDLKAKGVEKGSGNNLAGQNGISPHDTATKDKSLTSHPTAGQNSILSNDEAAKDKLHPSHLTAGQKQTSNLDSHPKTRKTALRNRRVTAKTHPLHKGTAKATRAKTPISGEAALANKDATLANKDAALANKDAALANKYAALAKKEAGLSTTEAGLSKKEAGLASKEALHPIVKAQEPSNKAAKSPVAL